MRRKIREDPTTQKHQKIFLTAPTAANHACLTVSAPLADITETRQFLGQPLPSRRIGVDLMGGDNAPPLLLDALKKLVLPPGFELLLIGRPELENQARPFAFHSAPEVIEMGENPLLALRRKKGASMCVGLRLLKEGKIDAFVSAGNTGALVSSAKMILSTLPSILRPCLVALMPTKKNPVAVLDVGANIQVKAPHLIQFALIGAAYQMARGIENPSVGLLNIGSEAMKGTSEQKSAYQVLQKMPLRFAGNIEGKTVFDGDVDVLVTDGFTGNVFLKTAEGIASLILDRLQAHVPEDAFNNLHLKDLQKHLHYAEYPGALLAGVRGVVVKCHGYSTPQGFIKGILGAVDLVKEEFILSLQNKLDYSSGKRTFNSL